VILSAVLAVALAAVPRPLPKSESGLYLPRLDRLEGLLAFMTRAGERAVTLRPSTWFSEFHPLLELDFTRGESLAEAGIAPAGSATLSWLGDGRMTCLDLSNPERFEARARERLATLGTLWEGKLRGSPVVAARSPEGALLAGYARKGNLSCAVSSPSGARPLLEAAIRAMDKPSTGGGWGRLRGVSGALFFVSPDGVAGLDGTRRSLTVDGRARLPAPSLAKGGQSPYAPAAGTGLLWMRAQIARADVPSAVSSLTGSISKLCASCAPGNVPALNVALGELLTGQVSLLVEGMNVRGRLRSDAERYFALRHAWLAEIDDPAMAMKVLHTYLGALPGARATGAGYAIAVAGGEISVGVQGRQLFVANDSSALKGALNAVADKPSPLAHGAELQLNPARTARALAGISLLDVMSSKEMAGLFALSTELGPLLSITESVRAFADGGRGSPHQLGLTWTLRADI
jgi:hypothetical protein